MTELLELLVLTVGLPDEFTPPTMFTFQSTHAQVLVEFFEQILEVKAEV